MTNNDWDRNTTWSEEIEATFEARLKRSRGDYSKAQSLRIQASYLLDSKKDSDQRAGVKLMIRLINDYPNETFSTIFGHEQLGDYYLSIKDYHNAEQHFRIVANYYETSGTTSGTTALADLKLAETIYKANIQDKLQEAYQICKNYPPERHSFNSAKFYFNELSALICKKLNKMEEAKEYAQNALNLAKINQPQFARHKTVGLVNVEDQRIYELQNILE